MQINFNRIRGGGAGRETVLVIFKPTHFIVYHDQYEKIGRKNEEDEEREGGRPGRLPVEVWKCLGESALEFLTKLYNRTMESERMPEEWRDSILIPIFKNKGDAQSCSNYRGITLISNTMKLWERVVERRLRSELISMNNSTVSCQGKALQMHCLL